MLQFENPYAFLFILTIPIFYILRKIKFLNPISFPTILSDWEGKTFCFKNNSQKIAKIFSCIIFYVGFISLIIAFASPVFIKKQKVFTTKGSEFIFVIDTSPSMAALDIGKSSRLQIAKDKITSLIKNMTGSTFGLVALGSEAASIVPPTMDYDFFNTRLNSLQIGELGDGTAIGTGLSTAAYHLVTSKAPNKIIILFTDGENNAGIIHPNTAAKIIKDNQIKLYTVGIGTKGLVQIEYTDQKTQKRYSGFMESNFDEELLRNIALDCEGNYFFCENTESLEEALKHISNKETIIQNFFYKNIKEKHYETFLIYSVIAFLISWIIRRLYMKELI